MHIIISYITILFLIINLCMPYNTAALTAPKTKIACVGDSITYGLKVDDYARYPAVLGSLLGKGYEVKNFGVSNTSASDHAMFPYKNTDEYRQSVIYDPDIVIIMLGTNDAKGINWTNTETFKEEYKELIESYPNAKIIAATPPKAFCVPLDNEWTDPDMVNVISGLIKEIAAEEKIAVADINAKSKKEWIRTDDGIHMTNAGSVALASAMRQIVQQITAL